MSEAPLIVPARVDDAGLDVWTFRALGHVARRAGEGGLYYGAGTRSAKTCAMSLRQWRRAITDLVRLGYLVVTAEPEPGRPIVYRVETSAPQALVPGSHQCTAGTSASQAPDQCQVGTPTGAPQALKGVPLKESRKEDGSRSPDGSRPSPDLILTAPSNSNGAGKETVLEPEVIPPGPALELLLGGRGHAAARVRRKPAPHPERPKGWNTTLSQDYTEASRGGVLEPQVIGSQLGALVDLHGFDVVRGAFVRWAASGKGGFGLGTFKREFGRYATAGGIETTDPDVEAALADFGGDA